MGAHVRDQIVADTPHMKYDHLSPTNRQYTHHLESTDKSWALQVNAPSNRKTVYLVIRILPPLRVEASRLKPKEPKILEMTITN